MSEKNPYDLFSDEDDDGGDDEGQRKQPTVEELQKANARMGKALRDAEKALKELGEFKAEAVKQQRVTAIEAVFKDAGLNPKQSGLYAALNPDVDPAAVTKEAVQSFAAEHGLVAVAEGEGGAGETPAPQQAAGRTGFTPAPTGQAAGSPGFLTREDWLKLAGTDPKAAEAAFLAGRVDLSETAALKANDYGPNK